MLLLMKKKGIKTHRDSQINRKPARRDHDIILQTLISRGLWSPQSVRSRAELPPHPGVGSRRQVEALEGG